MCPKDIVSRLKNPEPINWWMGRFTEVPFEELPQLVGDYSAIYREYPQLALSGLFARAE